MKQRDLFYLQELAGDKFVNISQIGDFAVAEATNGFCYMRIADENHTRFTQGLYKFTGKGNQEDVILPKGYEIRDSSGEVIGVYQYSEPYDIRTGEQGEFFATFDREDLLYYLKYYLSTWRKSDAKKYTLVFHRSEKVWKIRGYIAKQVRLKELPPEDNITDTTFRFMVNPHTLRLILKWFEDDKITLWFDNGNYETRKPIFMKERNKLAVLMPIARTK